MRELILLSGWGCNLYCWMPLLNAGAQYTLIPWQECLGDTQDDNALLRRLKSAREPVAVAGWSLGALIALGAAQQYPEKISGMLLLSATARLCSDTDYPGADARALRAMIVKLQRKPEQVLYDFAALSACPDAGVDFLNAFTLQAKGFEPEMLVRGLHYFEQADYREDLDRITCPVQVLHGAEDQIVPAKSAQWLAEVLPQASLEILPGKGHALPYTATPEIMERIPALR